MLDFEAYYYQRRPISTGITLANQRPATHHYRSVYCRPLYSRQLRVLCEGVVVFSRFFSVPLRLVDSLPTFIDSISECDNWIHRNIYKGSGVFLLLVSRTFVWERDQKSWGDMAMKYFLPSCSLVRPWVAWASPTIMRCDHGWLDRACTLSIEACSPSRKANYCPTP